MFTCIYNLNMFSEKSMYFFFTVFILYIHDIQIILVHNTVQCTFKYTPQVKF